MKELQTKPDFPLCPLCHAAAVDDVQLRACNVPKSAAKISLIVVDHRGCGSLREVREISVEYQLETPCGPHCVGVIYSASFYLIASQADDSSQTTLPCVSLTAGATVSPFHRSTDGIMTWTGWNLFWWSAGSKLMTLRTVPNGAFLRPVYFWVVSATRLLRLGAHLLLTPSRGSKH